MKNVIYATILVFSALGITQMMYVSEAEGMKKDAERMKLNSLDEIKLVQAVSNEKTDEVKALLEKGADVNTMIGLGIPLLNWACVRGNLEIVKLLIFNGANVNARGQKTRKGISTPLSCARNSGNEQLVEYLIKQKAWDEGETARQTLDFQEI